MNVQITKEADALLCVIYKSYCVRRKEGIPKFQAKFLGSSADIQESLVTKMTPEDTDETCWELHRAGMLHSQPGDNIAYSNTLTDEAIIHMENRFKNGINDVLEYLSKVKGVIPFV